MAGAAEGAEQWAFTGRPVRLPKPAGSNIEGLMITYWKETEEERVKNKVYFWTHLYKGS